jgi:hypothetical protein
MAGRKLFKVFFFARMLPRVSAGERTAMLHTQVCLAPFVKDMFPSFTIPQKFQVFVSCQMLCHLYV